MTAIRLQNDRTMSARFHVSSAQSMQESVMDVMPSEGNPPTLVLSNLLQPLVHIPTASNNMAVARIIEVAAT